MPLCIGFYRMSQYKVTDGTRVVATSGANMAMPQPIVRAPIEKSRKPRYINKN